MNNNQSSKIKSVQFVFKMLIKLFFLVRYYKTNANKLLNVFIYLPLILISWSCTSLKGKFEKTYLKRDTDTNVAFFRQYADSIGFYIGSIGNVNTIANPKFHRNFNSITLENELKHGSLLVKNVIGKYDFSRADSIIDVALSQKLRVRGHVLVWGKESDKFKSPDLDAYLKHFPRQERSKLLWGIVENHVRTVMSRYKGKIFTWDAINEPLTVWGSGGLEKNVYYRYLGENYISEVLKLAHSIDPDVKLYINEFFWNYKDKRAESFYMLIKTLKENNVPIHGVGIQAHVPFSNLSFEDLRKFMKRLTDLGVEVEITELDARLRLFKSEDAPYQAQGEFYARILNFCLENPLCVGLTFWGFSDDDCWYDDIPMFMKPNEPYLFDADVHPKPAFHYIHKEIKSANLAKTRNRMLPIPSR
jgi:endo-1,4-beta-xylanase